MYLKAGGASFVDPSRTTGSMNPQNVFHAFCPPGPTRHLFPRNSIHYASRNTWHTTRSTQSFLPGTKRLHDHKCVRATHTRNFETKVAAEQDKLERRIERLSAIDEDGDGDEREEGASSPPHANAKQQSPASASASKRETALDNAADSAAAMAAGGAQATPRSASPSPRAEKIAADGGGGGNGKPADKSPTGGRSKRNKRGSVVKKSKAQQVRQRRK